MSRDEKHLVKDLVSSLQVALENSEAAAIEEMHFSKTFVLEEVMTEIIPYPLCNGAM